MKLHEILKEMEELNVRQSQFHGEVRFLASFAKEMMSQGEYEKADRALEELNKTIEEYMG